jgi:HlyD family secretion protein
MGRRTPILILALVLALAGVLGYKLFLNRAPRQPSAIRVSGNIELTDVELSFKIPGIVKEREVDEGESVAAGQVVARLDDSELVRQVSLGKAQVEEAEALLQELKAGSRPEEIAQAEAVAQRAQARLDELVAGSRPQEVAAAEAEVNRAAAEAANLKTEYTRQVQLRERGVVTPREYDAARAAYEVAAARLASAQEQLKLVKEGPRKEQIAQAQAALEEAKAAYALTKEGPRKERIEQARARLAQMRDSEALAETQLGYATLRAPFSGLVLSKNAEPGEYVSPGTPIVVVGDLEHVWLRAYVEETDLGRVKLGQRAYVTTDTYPGKVYQGRLSFIASEAEFTPRNVQTQKERVKLVYRIKIDIPNPAQELKPGMPADAEIVLSGSQ